jgi:hypothetical protein
MFFLWIIVILIWFIEEEMLVNTLFESFICPPTKQGFHFRFSDADTRGGNTSIGVWGRGLGGGDPDATMKHISSCLCFVNSLIFQKTTILH